MDCRAAQLRKRTTDFALRVVRLFRALPNCSEARVIGHPLLRSATSVAANYRAACRARSRADFISKLGIVEEEAEVGLVKKERLLDLIAEGNQLTAFFVASRITAKTNNRQSPIVNRKSRNL
jgi:hypothetical protein